MKRLLRLLLLRFIAVLVRPFVRRPAAQVARILYLKPDHLGDLLLATPVLAALRQEFPQAQITALVGPWAQVVLQHNPDVDCVLTCPFPGFTRRPAQRERGRGAEEERRRGGERRKMALSSIFYPLSSILYLLSSIFYPLSSAAQPYWLLLRYGLLLRAGRYDLAIVGRDDHWWGAALVLVAGAPRRVGYAVPECRPFLTQALPWRPQAQVTEQGLALVAASQEPATDRRPPTIDRRGGEGERGRGGEGPISNLQSQFASRFDPLPDEIAWADRWLAEQGIGAGERLAVIHPGTGGAAKLWFADRWAQVADALEAGETRVLLTGGPGEEPLVEAVAGQMRRRPPALAGRTTVGQLAALLRRATLVLGVDSGPLHLAAAQGIPTLHLYGPSDAGRFRPWGDPGRHVVVRAGLWCSPCGVFSACPRGLARPECMDRIAVAQVMARARQLLIAASAPHSIGRAPHA